MTSLRRFWQAIESLPSLAAVEAEWLANLRGEYQLIKPFLRPRTDLAISYPRLDGGSPYQVTEHGRDDLVGVCQETGETIALTKNQLVVYALDRHRLGKSLADAWGIDCGGGPEDWSETTVHLGHFTSVAKTCYTVFLAFPNESKDIELLATRLIAEKHAPIIILAPSRRWLRPATESAMRTNGCVFVFLAGQINAPRAGHLEAAETLEAITLRESGIPGATNGGAEVDSERNVFRQEGDFWRLTYACKTVRVKNRLGLHCIAHLISKKRCSIGAAVLRAIATKNIMLKPLAGIEVGDLATIEQCKLEYEDLVEQLEEAKKFNDVAKHEQIQEKIDKLTQQVNSVKGLGGRFRRVKDQTDNARTSVTNAIGRTIRSLKKPHADLARHLHKSIQTGRSMSYSPETDVDWDL